MPTPAEHTGPLETLFRTLRHAVMDGAGSTPVRVRHVVAYAPREELSPELRDFVTTLREHAYRVTDEQVAELLAAGWSEDQVYELTIAAAVGAGQRRLDAGLAALAVLARDEAPGAAPGTAAQARVR